jgi:hypothetical protein
MHYDGESGEQARRQGHARPHYAPLPLTPEKHPGREAERRREHMGEEQGRKRQQQCARAGRNGRGEPVSGSDEVADATEQQEQERRGQHAADQPERPERSDRLAGDPRQPRHQFERARPIEQDVERECHEREARRLRRVIVAVDPGDVARLVAVRIDRSGPVGERAHQRVRRVLVPPDALWQARAREHERRERGQPQLASGHAATLEAGPVTTGEPMVPRSPLLRFQRTAAVSAAEVHFGRAAFYTPNRSLSQSPFLMAYACQSLLKYA